MKVIINTCYGGFQFSPKALAMYHERTGRDADESDRDLRDDLVMVAIVEELGPAEASGDLGRLKVVTIPDDVSWHVVEYDGCEHIAEDHRTWR